MADEAAAVVETVVAETPAAAPDTAAPAITEASAPPAKPETQNAEAAAPVSGEGDKSDPGLGPSFLGDDDKDNSTDKADGQTDAAQEEASAAYQPFTLPEGITIDDAALARATPVLREIVGADQDKAQKLVSFHAEEVQRRLAEQAAEGQANHRALLADWSMKAKADPEIGGAKFEQNLAIAKKALADLGTPELKSMLVEWGLDRSPEILRFLVRAGQRLSPDTLVTSNEAPPAKPQSHARTLFPEMYPKE